MSNQQGDDGSGLNRCQLGKGFDPTDFDMLPRRERDARPFEVCMAMTDGNDLFVDSGDIGRVLCNPRWTVRQWQQARLIEETINLRRRWTSYQEHGWLTWQPVCRTTLQE